MPIDAPDWYSVDMFKQKYGSQMHVLADGGALGADATVTVLDVDNQGELLHFIAGADNQSLWGYVNIDGDPVPQYISDLANPAFGGGDVELSMFQLRKFNGDTELWSITRDDDINDVYMYALKRPLPFYSKLNIHFIAAGAGMNYAYKIVYRTYT